MISETALREVFCQYLDETKGVAFNPAHLASYVTSQTFMKLVGEEAMQPILLASACSILEKRLKKQANTQAQKPVENGEA